jgi:6-pyruvoyl-tetrahydropterin synthase
VQTFTKATATFDASHQVKLPLRCSKQHGHSFRVSAMSQGEYEPELQEGLEVLLRELDGRDVNAMLTAGDPSVTGMAHWIMERLLGSHPRLVKVEVEDSKGLAGSAVREFR